MHWHIASLRTESPTASQPSSGVFAAIVQKFASYGIDLTSCEATRAFPRFGALAVLTSQDVVARLAALPEVLSAIRPVPISRSNDGRWYVNLLAAFEHVVNESEHCAASCINMSLRPPESPRPGFDPQEPINRATKVACDLGIVTVIAAGNEGESGEDTMTSWASPGWVISVGAADEGGTHVRAYSSKGSRLNASPRPTIVASDQTQPFPREGTSFAAPNVTDIVHFLLSFFVALWTMHGLPLASIKPRFPEITRRALVKLARPINGKPYEIGAGYVSQTLAAEWVRSLNAQTVAEVMGRALDPDQPPDWAKYLPRVQEAAARRQLPSLFNGHIVARFSIDTGSEWTRPTFVPGLLRITPHFLLREGDEFTFSEDFDAARLFRNDQRYEEISILPKAQLGRTIQVGSHREYSSIQAAIDAAKPWDVITIDPGTYDESIVLKSGITLQGSSGTVILSRRSAPVTLDSVVDVTLANLEIVAFKWGADAVSVHDSVDVVIKNCKLSSNANALGIYASRRCAISDTKLVGTLNGLCILFSSQWTVTRSVLAGWQAGLLVYGQGGKLEQSKVQASAGDGIIWVYRGRQWTAANPTHIYIYPSGAETVSPEQVNPDNIYAQNFAGWLSVLFCTVQVQDSIIEGKRNGVAANLPEHVVDKRSELGNRARIQPRHSESSNLLNVSLSRLKRQIENRLRSVVYETQQAEVSNVEFGTAPPFLDEAYWHQLRQNLRQTQGYWSSLFIYWSLRWTAKRGNRGKKVNIRVQ
jgi:Subtilase family/Periplasmic copper-binding protein (NosD)